MTGLVRLYNDDLEKVIVNDENLFLNPLKQILKQINLFKSSYVHDISISLQNKNYLNEILPILNTLIIKIINKEEVTGDFTTFVQIITRLPESKVLFAKESSESSIILTR